MIDCNYVIKDWVLNKKAVTMDSMKKRLHQKSGASVFFWLSADVAVKDLFFKTHADG